MAGKENVEASCERSAAVSDNVTDEKKTATKDAVAEIKAQLLEEIRAEMKAEVRAEFEAEAEKNKKKTEPYKETKKEIERANEPVKLKLFKDKDRYKEDVLVIINGQSWLIKRGVEVEVPRKVANVLKISDNQIGEAADIINGYEEVFEEKKDKLV